MKIEEQSGASKSTRKNGRNLRPFHNQMNNIRAVIQGS